MADKWYRVHHGWVQDVVADRNSGSRLRLELRLEKSRLIGMSLRGDGTPIRLEDEVSVVVDQARPNDALILVNHTTGQGMNYLQMQERRWPGHLDMLAIAVGSGWLGATMGGTAVPAILVFILGYWSVTRWYPRTRRRKAAAGIDYLLDKDYCRWRATLDRQMGEP